MLQRVTIMLPQDVAQTIAAQLGSSVELRPLTVPPDFELNLTKVAMIITVIAGLTTIANNTRQLATAIHDAVATHSPFTMTVRGHDNDYPLRIDSNTTIDAIQQHIIHSYSTSCTNDIK